MFYRLIFQKINVGYSPLYTYALVNVTAAACCRFVSTDAALVQCGNGTQQGTCNRLFKPEYQNRLTIYRECSLLL